MARAALPLWLRTSLIWRWCVLLLLLATPAAATGPSMGRAKEGAAGDAGSATGRCS